jgi:hypothetical protein
MSRPRVFSVPLTTTTIILVILLGVLALTVDAFVATRISSSSCIRRSCNSFVLQSQTIDEQESTTISSSVTMSNTEKSATATASESKSSKQRQRNVALLLCPAQFCVPEDYNELWDHLPSEISSEDDSVVVKINKELSQVVPLSRRDWIKVSKQLPTAQFWNGQLENHKTLDWYFEKLEEGFANILHNDDEGDGVDSICLVGHSIGGWVARAYLGGLSR